MGQRRMSTRDQKSEANRNSDKGQAATSTRHLLTVVLEDYFHVAPLKSVVHAEQWYRFERRVESNTHRALDLLDEYDISATFFVLGSIADEMPELVREVAERGHEIASKGYFHHSIRHLTREEFRDDLVRSREALQRASGTRVDGFRMGHRWFAPEDLWALDILAEEGFAYDSSVRPLFRRYAGDPRRRKPHLHRHEGHEIWEFPLSSWTIGGWSCPISGGNYFRQMPQWMMRRAVKSWIKSAEAPFLMYFHVWELDPDQPRIQAVPLREKIRQYRNLDKMDGIVRNYLDAYSFTGIGDYLGIKRSIADQDVGRDSRVSSTKPAVADLLTDNGHLPPVSVVVPCFNEELILPYLSNTLHSVETQLGQKYDLRFVFVDDGSADGTWSALERIFGHRANCVLVKHPENRGVAAAIKTGLDASSTEIICSIDCDCTYDPHQLQKMIPMLTGDVDMVVASPYHADGVVRNVPGWRLFLSKSLSNLYRIVLHHRLATYTSCFRVYRRSATIDIDIEESGFLGVVEMLGLLDLQGGKIAECPAVLEVRLLGRSKMKTLRTIFGHLGLLARFGAKRLVGPKLPADQKKAGATVADENAAAQQDVDQPHASP